MKTNKIIIGSRKSRLALIQTDMVKAFLQSMYCDLEVEIKTFDTEGDKVLDKPLFKIGDKGLFTQELENGLESEEIDIAVHSLKDLPTELPSNLILSAYSKRAESRDCLVSEKHNSLDKLPQGAKVGTSSLRRRSQLLKARPDLNVVDLRGNVETRLKKLRDENMDGIVIAACGLTRLGLENKITEILPFEIMLPAVSQGIIAVQSKAGRDDIADLMAPLNDEDSRIQAGAERAFLNTVEGGCQVPVGTTSKIVKDEIQLEAFIGSIDGKTTIRKNKSGKKIEAKIIGEALAKEMLNEGGDKIIAEVRNHE